MKPRNTESFPTSENNAFHSPHFEITDEQIKASGKLAAEAGLALASIVGGVLILRRCGGVQAIAEKIVPLLEDSAPRVAAAARRLTDTEKIPFPVYTSDGLELSLSKNARFYNQRIDLISVWHPTLGETHLARDGSRFVQKSGFGNFYDEAGRGIHVALPGTNQSIRFINKEFTPENRRTFRALEKCIRTRTTKPIEHIPDLFEHVSRF